MVRWIKVQTEAGKLRALVFWAGPKEGDGIVLKLPPERVAWILARACGACRIVWSISTTPSRTSRPLASGIAISGACRSSSPRRLSGSTKRSTAGA